MNLYLICLSEHRPDMLPNIMANWARNRIEPRARLLWISDHPWPEQDPRVIHRRPLPGASLGANRNAALQYIRSIDPDSAWGTFDDDDYYSRAYGTEILFSLESCELSGKSKLYIFLPSWGVLQIKWRYPAGSSLAGYTRLTIFRDLNLGEDMDLIRVAESTGLRIGIRSEYHYAYIRHTQNTWRIPELAVLADQQRPIPRWHAPSPNLLDGQTPPPPDDYITLPHMCIG